MNGIRPGRKDAFPGTIRRLGQSPSRNTVRTTYNDDIRMLS